MLVDELDLAIVHGLQLAPRAAWSDLAGVLDIDPATAAKRWARLIDEGLAWVTVLPSPERGNQNLVAGIAIIECALDRVDAVADQLSGHPWVIGVERVSGDRPLVAEIMGPSYDHLAETIAWIEKVDGLRGLDIRIAANVVSEAGVWRLDALSAAQQHRMQSFNVAAAPGVRGPSDRVVDDIAACLRRDPRASVPSIAAWCGVSPSTARRQLTQVLGSRALRLRVDLAQPATGFSVKMTAWWQVPVTQIVPLAGELASFRTTRLTALIATGPANLVFASWLRAASDVAEADLLIESAAPSARLIDRVMTLRTYKRTGRLLDHRGRALGSVPLEL